MKFGFRTPSLKKRFAARTSAKRFVAHKLGFKAPPGGGLLTNPKKAIYNKVYSKTTIDPVKALSGSKRRKGRTSATAPSTDLGLIESIGNLVAFIFGVIVFVWFVRFFL